MSNSSSEHLYEGLSKHRGEFGTLLAANPNYFGNLSEVGLPPVVTVLSDTAFEQLTCVSYNPQREQLEATFQVKLTYGFGGVLCTAGSWEYVRFWLDYGGGWTDAGLAGVNVHDLPAGQDCTGADHLPVSYTATLSISPQTKFCTSAELPKVRAILSWATVPPGATSGLMHPADWQPVFGNVLDAEIQIAPRLLLINDILAALDTSVAKLPGPMQAAANVPIPVPEQGPLDIAQLATLYKLEPPDANADTAPAFAVPVARFGAHAIVPALSTAQPLAAKQAIDTWAGLGLNWPSAVTALLALGGDTAYEQLGCVGLDVSFSTLTAAITIKRPVGYSGGLCTAGSTEYVAFWGDYGDSDCKLKYLGTAAVNVHDIPAVPAGGLEYAAILPVDLSAHLKPCTEPVLGRIRAVLSWNTPPSTTDPNAVPFWGNVVDTHVQLPVLRPGAGTGPNVVSIGGVDVAHIDTSTTSGTGLTLGDAHFSFGGQPVDDYSRACPFGGQVDVNGIAVIGGSYRVQVRNLTKGSGWTSLTDPVFIVSGGSVTGYNHAGSDDYYQYLGQPENVYSALANWQTTGNDLWELKLDARDSGKNPLGEARFRVQIDSTSPSVDIHIDNGGDCKTFSIGPSLIAGHFFAQDATGFFGGYGLGILPVMPGHTGVLSPTAGHDPTVSWPGNAWSLDTTGMLKCSYVATVQASSRTVRDSVYGRHWWSDVAAVGFALE